VNIEENQRNDNDVEEGMKSRRERRKVVNKWWKKEGRRKAVQWDRKVRESFDRAQVVRDSRQS
jgi:hypothetical protein